MCPVECVALALGTWLMARTPAELHRSEITSIVGRVAAEARENGLYRGGRLKTSEQAVVRGDEDLVATIAISVVNERTGFDSAA